MVPRSLLDGKKELGVEYHDVKPGEIKTPNGHIVNLIEGTGLLSREHVIRNMADRTIGQLETIHVTEREHYTLTKDLIIY